MSDRRNVTVYDVRRFGAVADFVSANPTVGTDNAAAFQAAVDKAQTDLLLTPDRTALAQILIPAGNWLCNAGVTIGSDRIHLVGDGRGLTTITVKNAPSPTFSLFKFQRNASMRPDSSVYISKCRVADLSVVSDGEAHNPYLLDLVYPSGFIVENVDLFGSGPLRIQYSIDTTIRKCGFAGATVGAGVFMDASVNYPSTTTNFYDCYIHSNRYGYRGGGTSGIAFHNCVFEANTTAALYLGEGTDLHDNVRAIGCHFEDNKSAVVAGGNASDADGGVVKVSDFLSVGSVFLGRYTSPSYPLYSFDLGWCTFTSIHDRVVSGDANDGNCYDFRVNRGGTLTTPRVYVLGENRTYAAGGYGPGGSNATAFALNDGGDSPFQGWFGGPLGRVATVASAASITPNFTDAGAYISTTLTQNLTINDRASDAIPPVVGQQVTFLLKQDGTGGWTTTWNAIYKTTYSDTGNTAGKRASVKFVYDGTNWVQEAITQWY